MIPGGPSGPPATPRRASAAAPALGRAAVAAATAASVVVNASAMMSLRTSSPRRKSTLGTLGSGQITTFPRGSQSRIRFAPVRYPRTELKAASALGAALRRVRYSESTVLEMLGDEAYSHDRDELPRDERRIAPTRLGSVVRALFLQLPVARADLVGALSERAVDALEAIGFAERAEVYRPRARILPVGELFVASDDYPDRDDEDP